MKNFILQYKDKYNLFIYQILINISYKTENISFIYVGFLYLKYHPQKRGLHNTYILGEQVMSFLLSGGSLCCHRTPDKDKTNPY